MSSSPATEIPLEEGHSFSLPAQSLVIREDSQEFEKILEGSVCELSYEKGPSLNPGSATHSVNDLNLLNLIFLICKMG